MMENPKLLFVVGSGRSGTTAFYRHICSQLDVGYFPALAGRYPSLMWPAVSLTGYVSHRAFAPSAESRVLFERHGLGHAEIQRLGRPIVASDSDPKAAADFRKTLWRIGRLQRKSVVVIKNTSATTRLGSIGWMAPDARFAHLVRDGRAVAASLSRVDFFPGLRLWWADGRTASELVSEYGSLALVGAEHWSRQVVAAKTALGEFPEDRYVTVRYEDFVTRPQEALEAVLDLMPELSAGPAAREADPVSSRSLHRWRQDLTDQEISTITDRYAHLFPTVGIDEL